MTNSADLAVTKTGHVLDKVSGGDTVGQAANEAIIEVTKDNPQVYFHGLCIKLPTSFGGREYFRTLTGEEFIVADPRSGEVVFSFPLPLVALYATNRYVNSHAIQGVFLANPNAHWRRKYEQNQALLAERGDDAPTLFRLE